MAMWSDGTGSGNKVTVDTNKAAYVRLRGPNGGDLGIADRSPVVPGSLPGIPILGMDAKVGRVARSFSDGSLVDARPVPLLFDPIEGSAVNTNTWTQTTTTMTITQASGVITFNANSTTTTTTGAMHTGQRLAPLFGRGRLLFRSRQRHTTHFTNNLIELGFLTPASATAVPVGTGAMWRKDGTGQYVPVIAAAGSETLGTPVSNATFVSSVATTDFAVFEVELDELGAWFRILKTDGTAVSEQRVDLPPAVADLTVTRFTPCIRTYNNAAVATAVQVLVAETSVSLLDADTSKPWSHQLSGLGLSAMQSPTAYTQTANYTLNVAPTTRTVTAGSILEATLGGQVSWNNGGTSFAASDNNDYILFGFLVPTPYAFVCTGVRISTVNLGATNGTNPYTILYSLAFNSNGASLNTATPNNPRFMPLGFQALAAGAANGAVFDRDTVWTPGTPVTIMPGRYLHLVARVLGSSLATTSQVIRTVAAFDGYFE